jgi:hypothetical protein
MSLPLHLPQDINGFFDVFAQALSLADTKTMAYLYHMPCTLMSDDSTVVFNDAAKLEGFFNQGVSAYKQIGIVSVYAETRTRQQWTRRIVLAKVRWVYKDKDAKLIYHCDYEYVLKMDKANQWKIIMSVSMNEKEQLEQWRLRQAG